MMWNSTIISRIIYLLFLAALGLAIYSIKDKFSLLKISVDPDYIYIFFAILLQFIFWLTSSYSWNKSVHVFAGHKLSLSSGFIQSNIVTIGKYLPGKIWGLVSRGVDLKQQGIDNKKTLLVSYIDQILLLHAGVITGVISLALSKNIVFAVIVFIIAILSVPFVPKSHNVLAKVMMRFVKNIDVTDLESIMTVQNYSKLIMYYLAVWLLAGLIFASIYFAFYGFNFNLLLPLIGANAIGIVVGFIAIFAPAGLGVREATSTGIMIEFIPVEEALFLVVVYRLWTVLTDITGGVFAFGLFYFQRESISVDKMKS